MIWGTHSVLHQLSANSAAPTEITVSVTSLTGRSEEFVVFPLISFEALKRQIGERFNGIPLDSLRLVMNGRQLIGSVHTLRDLGIVDGSDVKLFLGLRGC